MPELSIDNSFTSLNPASINKVAAGESKDELSQADFIELLVAQVKNQDPTKPMDPSQFMNQLTQSSMVNGLNDLQNSFDDLATKLSADQSLQAAGLVGKSVLLPGGQGLLTNASAISGEVSLDQLASDLSLNIYSSNGEQVRTLPLGGHAAGSVQFKWDAFADDGSALPLGNYLVTAAALINGEQQAVEVLTETRIDSISLNQSDDGVPTGTLLNLASGQSVSLNEVKQIK